MGPLGFVAEARVTFQGLTDLCDRARDTALREGLIRTCVSGIEDDSECTFVAVS